MEAQCLATLGLAGPPSWVDAQKVLYPSGNGLVSHDVLTGCQTHVWGNSNRGIGGSCGVPVYAVCPSRQLAAVAYNAADASVQFMSLADFQTLGVLKEPTKESGWHALSLSTDGSRLAGISSYPDHWLDIWNTEPVLNPAGGAYAVTGAASTLASVARVRLGPRLAHCPPVFFPLNPGVLAVAGQTAARVYAVEPLLGSQRLHQADVDVSVLREGETLTCVSWSATGTLLLGTSQGRLLSVTNAAPATVLERNWGSGPLSLTASAVTECGLAVGSAASTSSSDAGVAPCSSGGASDTHGADVPPPQAQQLGAVVSVFTLSQYVLMVHDAPEGLSGAGHMVWLQGGSLQVAAVCPLPCGGGVAHASLSPTLDSVLVVTHRKQLVLTDSLYSVPDQPQPQELPPTGVSPDPAAGGYWQGQDAGIEHGAEQRPMVHGQVLASFHAGRAGCVVMLPNEMFATGGDDGRVCLWHCLLGVTELGGLVPQAANDPTKPHFALKVTLAATWQLSAPITFMSGFMGGPLVMAGTSNGEVHVFNSSKVQVLVTSGSLVHLPQGRLGFQGVTAASTLSNASVAEIEDALAPVWAQRPFDSPVSAVAVSADGSVCAMCSTEQGMVVFYRVVSIGNTFAQVALHLLGFYAVRSPTLMAWAPNEPSASAGQHPQQLLVVSTTNGELQVLKPPESLGHLKQAGAQVAPGSLLVALLRLSSVVTAMTTAAAPPSDVAADKGSFWLFACCLDKSVRRVRVCTEQHKLIAQAALGAATQRQSSIHRSSSTALPRQSNASGVDLAPPTISAPQNFQTSETEKAQDLTTAACHVSLGPLSKHMTVATLCGSTCVYALPELTRVACWPLHAPVPTGDTTLGAPLAMYSGKQLVSAPPPPPP